MVLEMVKILLLVTVGVILAVLFLRIFGRERVRVGSRQFDLVKTIRSGGEHFTKKHGFQTLAWGVGVILLTYGISLLYCGIFGKGVTLDNFINAWKKYDSYHYVGLAELGYNGYTENGKHYFLVFLPLYPWLIRLFHLVIPNYALSGLLVSCLCYLGSLFVMGRLVTEEFGSKAGKLSLFFLSAYPFAFFFMSLHTESLFLLLSLLSFYFIRKHKYPLAGLIGALAALTRVQGVFLAPVALIEYCMSEHPIRKIRGHDWKGLWKDLWGKLFWMAFIGTGTLIYLYINYRIDGNPFAFLGHQQERWYQGSRLFTESLHSLWRVMLNPGEGKVYISFTTWGPQIVMFFFCLAFLIYSVRRLPPVWTVYFIVCLFLNISLKNPLSLCRYIACAFPLPVALAIWSERRPFAGKFLMYIYGVLQGVYMLAYFSGLHVC